MTKQFYEKALPSQGIYCVTGINRDGRALNRFAESIDEVVEIVDALSQAGENVFVALSTFDKWSRKGDNALYCRSFFVDLDVDPENPKKYPSKEAALKALDDFLELAKAPPPLRVDTGGGIHAYWLIDQDVPIAEWKRYATKFKQFCLDYMKIDPAVTADVSRILRCPDTVNYKYDPPRPTSLIDEDLGQYDFEQFKAFLGHEEPTVKEIMAGINPDLPPKPDNFEYVFADIAVKSLTDKGCAQIKHILLDQATVQEPLWRAGLSVAVRCTDGQEAIHQMSNKYSGYNPGDTETKANATLEAKWAYSCTVFEQLNPGGCDGCSFKGQFTKVGPIQLGRRLKEAPSVEEISEEDAVRIAENPEEVPIFPTALAPYVRGANGGVWYRAKSEPDEDGNDDGEMKYVQIIEYDFFALKRLKTPVDGECLLMRYAPPKDPVLELLVPVSVAYSHDKLKAFLPHNGITFRPSMVKYVSEYIIAWDDYLKKVKAAEIMRMQMGWTEDKTAFITGDTEISMDGTTKPASISPLIKNVARFFKPEGDYATWQKSANSFNLNGLELHAMGLLAGFGSPLMSRTSTPGATISYVSPDSGVGKTGAMYAGVSVFAHPYYGSLQEGSATDNALTGRYLNIRNIMFGFDEASNMDPEILSRFIHRVSSGRAKVRMQSSVNAEREIEMGASLIAVMTTNQSLYDKLRRIKKNPDGEIARLIEYRLEMPKLFIDNPGFGKSIVDPFNHNYGHAGPIFIKKLFELGEEEVSLRIRKWARRFSEDYGDNPAYRFYENVFATCFAGGEIANEAEIITLDLERIYKTNIKALADIRKDVFKLNATDYKALVTDFYYKHHSGFLRFDDNKCLTDNVYGTIVGRVEVHTGLQYISSDALGRYLASDGIQVSVAAAEKAWEKLGILVRHPDGKATKKRRLTTGWKSGTGAQAGVACYVFKTELPDEVTEDDAKV
jgi:hypothetical protein